MLHSLVVIHTGVLSYLLRELQEMYSHGIHLGLTGS